MVKILKYGLFAALVVIAVAVGFLLTLDVNQYKGELVQTVQEKTGRDFKIEGDLKFALSLIPTIAVEGISFGNADWGSQPAMIKAGRFEARVAILPLLGGNVNINKLVLHDAELFLETNKQGIGNWVLQQEPGKGEKGKEAPSAKPASSTELPAFAIKKVDIKNAKLIYKDGKSGEITTVSVPRLTSETKSWGDSMLVKLEAVYNKLAVKVNGTFGSLEQLMQDKPYQLDATINAGKAEMLVKGNVDHPASFKGINLNVSFKAETLQDFNQFTKGKLPGVGPLLLTGSLSDGEGKYYLKSLQVHVGKSDLSGDVSVALSEERPAIAARLDSQRIDLTPFEGEEKKKEKKARLFSKEPLPIQVLGSVDLDLIAKVKEIISSNAVLKDIELALKLDKGKLSLDPFKARIADGDLLVKVGLSPDKNAMRLVSDIRVKNMMLGSLPKLKKDKLIEEGKTNITINGKGRGRSVSEIMSGLNGKLLIEVGKGKIQNRLIGFAGADLITKTFSMVNPLSKEEKVTVLECGIINFNIKNGLASADKQIAFETEKMTAVGSGTINLKNEELDLGLRPYPREGIGINAGKFTQVARLRGTLANPKIKADTVAALKAAASTGAAVFTLGLSLVAEGAYDRTMADEHPCDTALGKKPPTEKTTTVTQEEEKPGVLESAGDKVKGVFKGLFGN